MKAHDIKQNHSAWVNENQKRLHTTMKAHDEKVNHSAWVNENEKRLHTTMKAHDEKVKHEGTKWVDEQVPETQYRDVRVRADRKN
jgi:hypothetical protein